MSINHRDRKRGILYEGRVPVVVSVATIARLSVHAVAQRLACLIKITAEVLQQLHVKAPSGNRGPGVEAGIFFDANTANPS